MASISAVRSIHAGVNSVRNFPLKKPSSFNSGKTTIGGKFHPRTLLPVLRAAKDATEPIVVASEKKIKNNAPFPDGFENLVLDVCDETDIAEIKLKVGGYEMHLRRNVGSPPSPPPPPSIVSPTTAPPIPSKPMTESIAALPPTAATSPKPVPKASFANNSSVKSRKLAELEASGVKTYAVVSSPTVGVFRRGRMMKGKRMPPSFKEGDLIDEGQIIGYLDQLGSELPVKSDVEGEVLKILYKDGDAVGYGDPLIAILPSFHNTIL